MTRPPDGQPHDARDPARDSASARDAGGPAADADRHARRLADAWEQRARSPSRDFFVASHPGWDDPATWEKQARHDADFLLQWLGTPLASADVLEIGCGVGRLVPVLAPRVASYTGFDIAPSMVAEARTRHAAIPNARFLHADGLQAPPGARDRRYHIALAHAVFIHCPREVIAALIADCWTLLADGGELRFQLRADPLDDTPLEQLPAATAQASAPAQPGVRVPTPAHVSAQPAAPAQPGKPTCADDSAQAEQRARQAAADQQAAGRVAVSASHAPLVEQEDYMGAAFTSAEVLPFLAALPGLRTAELSAVRVDRLHIYAAVRRPPAR